MDIELIVVVTQNFRTISCIMTEFIGSSTKSSTIFNNFFLYLYPISLVVPSFLGLSGGCYWIAWFTIQCDIYNSKIDPPDSRVTSIWCAYLFLQLAILIEWENSCLHYSPVWVLWALLISKLCFCILPANIFKGWWDVCSFQTAN